MISEEFPLWLKGLGKNSLHNLVFKVQEMQMPLILCSHNQDDTEILEPHWSRAVELTKCEIDKHGILSVASSLDKDRSTLILDVFEEHDSQWLAEFVMVVVIEVIWDRYSSMPWAEAKEFSVLPLKTPQLVKFINEDDLVQIGGEILADSRGFIDNGSIVPFHPKIAENRELLSYLIEMASESVCKVFLAPHYYKSFPVDEYKQMLVEDHAYGMPFARKDLNDPHKIGVTVHTRPDLITDRDTHFRCIFQQLLRVEFMWSSKQGKKTFQVEEIRSADDWRYLHAIYDLESESIEHLDGAWKVFDSESAAARRAPGTRFGVPKSQTKIKLFRVDGAFSIDVFSDLVSLFFRNNPLVHEYLAGHTGPSVSFLPAD